MKILIYGLAGFAAATFVGLVYTHELRSERNDARQAFEVQRDNIKSNYIVGWHTGFQAGANSTMTSIGLAVQTAQGTNAMAFMQSNVWWQFNLERPK